MSFIYKKEGSSMGAKQLPKCKTVDCEYNINGRCRILESTDFKGRKCPFFKEKESKENDK